MVLCSHSSWRLLCGVLLFACRDDLKVLEACSYISYLLPLVLISWNLEGFALQVHLALIDLYTIRKIASIKAAVLKLHNFSSVDFLEAASLTALAQVM
jgi:hypothetical protein